MSRRQKEARASSRTWGRHRRLHHFWFSVFLLELLCLLLILSISSSSSSSSPIRSCCHGFILSPSRPPARLSLTKTKTELSKPCSFSAFDPLSIRRSSSGVSYSSSPSRLYQTSSPEEALLTESASSLIDSSSLSPLNDHNPAALWSSAIVMLLIVGLLYLWEEAVIQARERLPATLMPVVDSMLAEMGGLGFIGLFLSMVVVDGPLGHFVEHVSEEYLGNGEILLETFEFLHTAFFETAIAFFIVAGLTVFRTLVQIESLADVSTAVFDLDGDGNVSCTELADFLNVQSMVVDSNQDGVLNDEEVASVMRTAMRPSLWDEIFMTTDRIRAEALVVRERFIQTCKVGTDFKIENYFGRVFGHNLEEIVELSPLTWLPLVPAISLGRSVDMSRNVVSASSENAYLSCGQFLGSPAFFTVSTMSAVVAAVWSAWNFYKMKQIKDMLVPTLVKCGKQGGREREATLLPPRYASPELFEQFNSSPGMIGTIESFFAAPARNRQEALFGVAGAAGPALYRNSIKFHTWLVVSQIVFWGLQIVARDAEALYFGWNVGNPDLLVPELVIFGAYVTIASMQLALAPQTFLNYCLVTTIEELVVDKWIYRDDVTTMKPSSVVAGAAIEVKQSSAFSPPTPSDS